VGSAGGGTAGVGAEGWRWGLRGAEVVFVGGLIGRSSGRIL